VPVTAAEAGNTIAPQRHRDTEVFSVSLCLCGELAFFRDEHLVMR